MLGYAVIDEQGVEKGTKHAHRRGPRLEDQRGRYVVAYTYLLRVACQKSRIQLQREVFSPRVLSLLMSFEGAMVLNAEL
jgi:hypothetical protein